MFAVRGGSLKNKYGLEINDTDIVTKLLETLLGVAIDNYLGFDNHISTIC